MKRFETDCVSSTAELISPMIDESEEITREQFLEEVDQEQQAEIEEKLGYGEWLTMDKDWHVSYHRSNYDGKDCVYFCWSAIEHVFV